MRETKQEKGITLIALVITIIVLLILAGVTISMLTGENGILNQANQSNVENDKATVSEKLKLEALDMKMQEETNGTELNKLAKLKEANYIDENNIVKVEQLLGYSLKTGNGSGTTDVYKLENKDSQYHLIYYDPAGNQTDLGTIFEQITYTDAKYFDFYPETGEITLKDADDYYNGRLTDAPAELETIYIPREINGIKVTKIGKETEKDRWGANHTIGFTKVKGIKKIVIPNTVTIISGDETTWGGGAFYFCEDLETVIIPDSVTFIGERAFYGDKNLKDFALPGQLKEIGDYAFDGCTSLKSITIPNGVTEIGRYAFNRCSALTNINLSKNLKLIKEGAFKDCTSLTSMILPDTLTSIEFNAFSGCNNINDIYIPNSVVNMESAFYDWTAEQTIYCQANSKPSGWNNGWSNNATVLWGQTKP